MESKWQEGWKVIFVENNGFRRSATLMGVITEYSINKIAKRQKDCGPLAVFQTSWSAKRFAKLLARLIDAMSAIETDNDEHLVVVKCKYIPSKDTSLWTKYFGPFKNLPEGTVLADKVKCLE